MTGYEICTAAVLIGGFPAALLVSSRGRSVDRLIGVEVLSATAVVAMLLMSQVTGQSSELIVPLVLVVLSVAGTLVFTRLIERPQDGP